MVDQASVRTNGAAASRVTTNRITTEKTELPAPMAMVSNVAGFGENLFTLTELQAKLAAIELRQNVEASKLGGAIIAGGALLTLVSLPLVLVGIAEILVSEVGMKRGFAFLGVAGVAIALGVITVVSAISMLRSRALGFPLTLEELSRNINWVRSVITHSGRSRSA